MVCWLIGGIMGERWLIGGVIVVGILALLISLRQNAPNRSQQWDRIERKLDLILSHLGLAPEPEVPEDIARLLARGETIEAIKVYRVRMGVGPEEARAAIEEFQRRLTRHASPPDDIGDQKMT
ncbi:MAG: hypothetical protein IRY99_09400 [Isosphaeraceae bacterium]|nr:hypothetical protein [Isosphaeraceae bacterium]